MFRVGPSDGVKGKGFDVTRSNESVVEASYLPEMVAELLRTYVNYVVFVLKLIRSAHLLVTLI